MLATLLKTALLLCGGEPTTGEPEEHGNQDHADHSSVDERRHKALRNIVEQAADHVAARALRESAR
jgi:hypothetical protein